MSVVNKSQFERLCVMYKYMRLPGTFCTGQVMLVTRSGYLGEVITGEASTDLIIPDATLDSVSTLVSLLYGGSSTVTHIAYAGLQSLCNSLGLNRGHDKINDQHCSCMINSIA